MTSRGTGALTLLLAHLTPYLFLLPYLLIFGVFRAWPIVSSFPLSFKDTRLGMDATLGLTNWKRVFGEEFFHTALRNALLVLIVQVPLMLTTTFSAFPRHPANGGLVRPTHKQHVTSLTVAARGGTAGSP